MKGIGQTIQLGKRHSAVLRGMSVLQENSLFSSVLVDVGHYYRGLFSIWTYILDSCEHPRGEDLSVGLAKSVVRGLAKK